jgi:primosomal replication protein N
LRYTPAGVPALDLVLRHEGPAVEAQSPRRVSVEIKAKAIGADLVRRLQAIDAGEASYEGFLAAARNGRGVVFHVSRVEPTDTPAAPATSPSIRTQTTLHQP